MLHNKPILSTKEDQTEFQILYIQVHPTCSGPFDLCFYVLLVLFQ